MKLLGHRVTRIRGALVVELADGRTGTVEVDLDVESNLDTWGVDHDWADSFFGDGFRLPSVPLATTYSLRLERPRPDRPMLTFRLPT